MGPSRRLARPRPRSPRSRARRDADRPWSLARTARRNTGSAQALRLGTSRLALGATPAVERRAAARFVPRPTAPGRIILVRVHVQRFPARIAEDQHVTPPREETPRSSRQRRSGWALPSFLETETRGKGCEVKSSPEGGQHEPCRGEPILSLSRSRDPVCEAALRALPGRHRRSDCDR
jgi:hypothetical protein